MQGHMTISVGILRDIFPFLQKPRKLGFHSHRIDEVPIILYLLQVGGSTGG